MVSIGRPIRRPVKETQMEFVHDYALLFTVAAPVLTVAAMNLYLALSGERGTLLVPSGWLPAVVRG